MLLQKQHKIMHHQWLYTVGIQTRLDTINCLYLYIVNVSRKRPHKYQNANGKHILLVTQLLNFLPFKNYHWAWPIKMKMEKLNFIEIQTHFLFKRHHKKMKRPVIDLEKYCQITYLIKDSYSEYIINSYKSTIWWQPNFKRGQNILKLSHQRRYTNALINKHMKKYAFICLYEKIWKNAPNQSLERCKLKSQ